MKEIDIKKHNNNNYTGKVRKHIRGFGFLIPDDPKQIQNLYLTPESLAPVMEGDRVSARIISRDSRLGPRAEVVEVLERNQTHCMGQARFLKGKWWLKRSTEDPDTDFLIETKSPTLPQEGKRYLARISKYPEFGIPPQAELLRRLDDEEAKLDVLRCSVERGWPMEFHAETLREVEKLQVRRNIPKWRKDLRDLPFVTIDGEDAKDFDDAVAAIDIGRGHSRVWVAIADVSHYVTTDSSVDRDAFERATSVYFPGTVSPMLPSRLSDDLCSLVPNQERDALVCEMEYAPDGTQTSYRFFSGRIQSQRRCTYAEVESFRTERSLEGASEVVCESLEILYRLYGKLVELRKRRGALDFDLPETRIYVDENGNPTQLIQDKRYESHKLIEEWMIAANVCAAEHIHHVFGTGIYRNHNRPDAKKLQMLMNLAKAHFPREAPKLEAIQKATRVLQQFINSVTKPELRRLFHKLALRSLPLAVYGSKCQGHYGLALEYYTHFTSPIRRYPDLIVHRLIKMANKGLPDEERHKPAPSGMSLDTAALQCSSQEREAMELEWQVKDIKKARFMHPRVGEAFRATITTVSKVGFFVLIDPFPIEGLVPIESLPSDRYEFDELRQVLAGRSPRHRFLIGDAIEVQCTQANTETGKITFELIYDGHIAS